MVLLEIICPSIDVLLYTGGCEVALVLAQTELEHVKAWWFNSLSG